MKTSEGRTLIQCLGKPAGLTRPRYRGITAVMAREGEGSQIGRVSFRMLFFLILVTAFVTVMIGGGTQLYQLYLSYSETTAPVIKITRMPKGVGVAPPVIEFSLSDDRAGLNDVVVRSRQKGVVKELLHKSFTGQRNATLSIELAGEDSGLKEGVAYIEIKAFDRSIWSNSSQEAFALEVDYRKPKVEVLSTQHNARHGGSQLVFYRANDDNLALSGVKVAGQTFVGYPARGLDAELSENDVYAVVYAVDLRRAISAEEIKLFAEDKVGNTTLANFYNKVAPRAARPVTLKVADTFVKSTVSDLADRAFEWLSQRARSSGLELRYESRPGTEAYYAEKFHLVNNLLREYSEEIVQGLLKGVRFDTFWTRAFTMPATNFETLYGDRQSYQYQGAILGDSLQTGYEAALSAGTSVPAANNGIVLFVEDIGVFGLIIAIDHGYGLVSLYGHLSNSLVNKGQNVRQGQSIGLVGASGFSRIPNLFFGMRVQGVPVDPLEWTDEAWFAAHITGKIIDAKRALGVEVYKPLNN